MLYSRLLPAFVFGSLALTTPALAVNAVIKNMKPAYAQTDVTLDGSGSSQGSDVTYAWTVVAPRRDDVALPTPPITDADKAVAHCTPPDWGVYTFLLTVTQGADKKATHTNIDMLNDPAKDTSPTYPGDKKVLYKQAPDALGGTASLYLHVFVPAGWQASDHRPVVLMFHGGGWVNGTPDRYLPDAQYWASRGLIGITGQYRIGSREGTKVAACVADAKSAVRYLRAHAAELGIDPQKIAVGGESAGAHIAACTGTIPGYSDPKDDATVSCVPNALLLEFPYKMIADGVPDKDGLSPLNYVSATTPATLFLAGAEDRIAPAERGAMWGDKMKGGNLFEEFIYARAHHPSGHHDMNKPGVDNDMIRQSDLFLAKLGWLTGDPTVPAMDADAIAKLHVDPATFQPPPDKK